MDHFGIGAGILGAMDIYRRASRGTGRTTSLVDSVKDADRVIFASSEQAKEFQRRCKERGVNPQVAVCSVDHIERLFDKPSLAEDGRLIFDHVWVEEFYRRTMERAVKDIDDLQKQISGFGAPHRETARTARAVHDWQQRFQ